MKKQKRIKQFLRSKPAVTLLITATMLIFGFIGYRLLQPTSASVQSVNISAKLVDTGASLSGAQAMIYVYNTATGQLMNRYTITMPHTLSLASGTSYRLQGINYGNNVLQGWQMPPPYGYVAGAYTSNFTSDSIGGNTITANYSDPTLVKLTFKVNGNEPAGTVTLQKGAGLTLSWVATSSYGVNGCSATVNWSGLKAINGSEVRTADTAAAGTKTYTLTCSNNYTSANKTVTVNVVNPTPSSPPPSPTPSPSPTPTPSPSVPQTTSKTQTSTPRIQSTQPVSDTTPPAAPGDFKASVNDGSTVRLTWQAASDNVAVQRYQVERMEGDTQWQVLSSEIKDTNFLDISTKFGTPYHYRVLAIDTSGNQSIYSTAEVVTPAFKADAKVNESTTVTSQDGIAAVTIAKDILQDDANCSLEIGSDISAPLNGYTTISGPYILICKLADGRTITGFKEALHATITLPTAKYKQYKPIKYFIGEAPDWREVQVTADQEGTYSFVLGDATQFIVMGQTAKHSAWPKIVIVMASAVSLAALGFGVVYLRIRRRQQQRYEEAYRKYHGL